VKLVPFTEEIMGEYHGEYQAGFRRKRSNVDQIFTMRQILAKCWKQNTDVQNLFIDFKTAYDTAWRKEIRGEMHKLSFSQNRSLCRILNNGVDVKGKIDKYSLNLKLKKV
jgi:hypothetical protein